MNRITVQLSGADGDDSPIVLTDFLKQLTALRKAMSETARVLAGSPVPGADLEIVGLSMNSPARVVLQPTVHGSETVDPSKLVSTFASAIPAIQEHGHVPDGFDGAALRAYASMGDLLGKSVSSVVLETGDEQLSIKSSLRANVAVILGKVDYVWGSVVGRLEKINIHSGQNTFTVYPVVGPQRGIDCHFKTQLLSQAVAGVGKYVQVCGRLAYNCLDTNPQEISVDTIEIYPESDPAFTLAACKGVCRPTAEGLSAEELIKEHRHGWQ